MKLIFDSLDALLAELKERKVAIVRVSRAVHAESGRPAAGIPHLTCRVIVTATIDDDLWAEWRLWVGRSLAEVGERGLLLPERLRTKSDTALADVARRIDGASLQIREGLLTHDAASMDSFCL
ncbi:MAG: hypothetical protein HY727_04995 [Candidatus Rokubacteria bacterium]|nr:hypothetical protein [Candidatus Rokubacteria bacterium]